MLRDLHTPVASVLGAVTNEPSGFPNLTDSNVSFDDGSLTFTIEPAATDFDFWVKGANFRKSAPQTKVITDVEGLHFFYFDDAGVLQTTTTFTSAIILDNAFVQLLYWDSTNKGAIILGEERHGVVMDGRTHSHWHLTHGTAFYSGLALSSILAEQSGALDSHAQLGVSNGVIADEDIVHTIGSIAAPASLPVFYRDGVNGWWRRQAAGLFPVRRFGTGRLAWNEWTGVTWKQTEVPNNDFVNAHLFATNDPNQPIIAVQGQTTYGNVPAAREGANVEINTMVFAGLPTIEFVVLGTVIFQTSNTYANTPKARIRSTDTGADYVDWRYASRTPGVGLASHNDLSGRDTLNSHPASALSVDASAFAGALSAADDTVQGALAALDGVHTSQALGGGAAAVLGTIGGSGPTGAAQNSWVEIKIGGVSYFLPAWT